MPRHNRSDQRIAAELLLRHLHHELVANVKTDIGRQEGQAPPETTLRELVADRPWLFQELSYHVDTTHLASVVRFARLVEKREPLELALDLTEYGRRLHPQFQYAGDEPFAEMYPSHALFFQALLGRDIEAALDYFRLRAEACDPRQMGTGAIEVYIDLLSRVGRADQAIEASERSLGPHHPVTANALRSRALLHVHEDQYEKARPLLERSIAITGESEGPDAPQMGDAVRLLARVEVAANRPDFRALRPRGRPRKEGANEAKQPKK